MKYDENDHTKPINEFGRLLDYLLDHLEKEHLDPKSKAGIVKEAIEATFKEVNTSCLDISVEVVELRDTLGQETDRGCVLTAVAYLDHELEKLFGRILIQDDRLAKDVLEGYGPLASLSARIDLAYGLGYLAPKQRRDLHLMRKIRNIFAHRSGIITFDCEEVLSRCRELYYDAFCENLPPRKKFIRVALGIIGAIQAAIMKSSHPRKAKDIDLSDPSFREKAFKVIDNIKRILQTESKHGVEGSR